MRCIACRAHAPTCAKSTVYPRIGSVALTYSSPHPAAAHACSSIWRASTRRPSPRPSKGVALSLPRVRIPCSWTWRRWWASISCAVGSCPRPWRQLGRFSATASSLFAGLKSLAAGRLDVPVLDAAAIGISFAKRDPRTAGLTMLLLNVGETLEEYTRSRSEGALIHALLDLPETAQLVEGDTEVQVPSSSLRAGQLIAVRTGMPVCVDGTVVRGCAMVNQAALTGEPLACRTHRRRRRVRRHGRRGWRGHRRGEGERGPDEAAHYRQPGRADRILQVPHAVAHGAPCRPYRAVELPAGGHRGAYHAQPGEDVGGPYGRLLLRAQAHRLHRRAVGHEPVCPGGLHGEGFAALRVHGAGRRHRVRQDGHADRGRPAGGARAFP